MRPVCINILYVTEMNLDVRIGKCFKLFTLSGTCENSFDGKLTKEQCCSEQIGKFSVAFNDGKNCPLCTSKRGKWSFYVWTSFSND